MSRLLKGAAVLWVGSLVVAGPAVAQVRTSPTIDTRPRVAEVYPKASFDKDQAEAALGKGSSSIVGVACAYHKKDMFRAPGITVMLFPASPYVEEWVKLRKNQKKNTVAVLSRDAFAMRIETKTDANGNFQFSEMQPGRYVLAAEFDYAQQASQDVYAGHSQTQYGGVDHYRRETVLIDRNDEMFNDVEIKSEGTTVKTSLTRGGMLSAMMAPCVKISF